MEDIKGWTEALMAKPQALFKQRSIIQLACAAVHAFNGDSAQSWDAIEQQEQRLLQLALDGEAAYTHQSASVHSVICPFLERAAYADQPASIHAVLCPFVVRAAYADQPAPIHSVLGLFLEACTAQARFELW